MKLIKSFFPYFTCSESYVNMIFLRQQVKVGVGDLWAGIIIKEYRTYKLKVWGDYNRNKIFVYRTIGLYTEETYKQRGRGEGGGGRVGWVWLIIGILRYSSYDAALDKCQLVIFFWSYNDAANLCTANNTLLSATGLF